MDNAAAESSVRKSGTEVPVGRILPVSRWAILRPESVVTS